MSNDETKILIDADVIIHFINGEQLDLIPQIFPNRIVVVDKVLEELFKNTKTQIQVTNFISQNDFERIELDSKLEYVLEYSKLIKLVGNGEAACMAIAKIEQKYIASSNITEITEYCNKHKIRIITTMDFLWEAFNLNLLAEDECTEFITKVKRKGSKLPVNTFEEYIKRFVMKN